MQFRGHKHTWRKRAKADRYVVCTWGMDGKFGNQCRDSAVVIATCKCDDARCAVHYKPNRRASKKVKDAR